MLIKLNFSLSYVAFAPKLLILITLTLESYGNDIKIEEANMRNRQSGKSETKVNQAMQPTDENQVMALYIINERTHLSLFHLN